MRETERGTTYRSDEFLLLREMRSDERLYYNRTVIIFFMLDVN